MAVVVEPLPNAMFKVELEAKTPGPGPCIQQGQETVRNLPGDRVAVELSLGIFFFFFFFFFFFSFGYVFTGSPQTTWPWPLASSRPAAEPMHWPRC